jgi:hypothetical protein
MPLPCAETEFPCAEMLLPCAETEFPCAEVPLPHLKIRPSSQEAVISAAFASASALPPQDWVQ